MLAWGHGSVVFHNFRCSCMWPQIGWQLIGSRQIYTTFSPGLKILCMCICGNFLSSPLHLAGSKDLQLGGARVRRSQLPEQGLSRTRGSHQMSKASVSMVTMSQIGLSSNQTEVDGFNIKRPRDPWVVPRFGACLWPRARSWRPGIESHVGLLVHGACFSSAYVSASLSLSLSV